MQKPLSDYTGEERRRIARLAKRSARSEVRLIMTAGFSLLMVILFFLGNWTFLPLAIATGIRPTVIWVAMSFGIAATWAYFHKRAVTPRIQWARTLDAAFLHDYQVQVQRENRKRSKLNNS